MDNKQIIKEFENSFNAYLKGFTSGRFGQDKDTCLANKLATEYTQLVKEDWESARRKAIANILFNERLLKENELMFGKQSKIYNDIYRIKSSRICMRFSTIFKRRLKGDNI